MITYKEYMNNSSELHQAFYAQFVTDETIDFIKSRIGIDKIKASKCHHLNDVVKMGASGGWIWDYSPLDLSKARQLGAVGKHSYPSQATHTCVGKAAARMLLAEGE